MKTESQSPGSRPRLILGSASARREKILRQMGLSFEIAVSDVDEVHHEGDPRRSVRENALAKNAWCRQRFADARILTADTVVDLDSRCLLKPVTMEEARGFLRMLSGRTHRVHTGVALSGPDGACRVCVETSEVRFKVLDKSVVDEYVLRVHPLDKAGGYDIDQSGHLLIESYSGSRTNIMGLPSEVVAAWLDGSRDGKRHDE